MLLNSYLHNISTVFHLNTVLGCTNVSPGCDNCPAHQNHDTAIEEDEEFQILKLFAQKPKANDLQVVINGFADTFHPNLTDEHIIKIMSAIKGSPNIIFHISTKRSERMVQFFDKYGPPPANAWIGVSVENQKHGLPRIEHLKQVKATVRVVNASPLLEDLGELNLAGIHWVTVTGEQNFDARKMELAWVRSIRDQCQAQQVPFYLRYMSAWTPEGTPPRKCNDETARLDGVIHQEDPLTFTRRN